MELARLGTTPITVFNNLVGALFTLAYLYQVFYTIWVMIRGEVKLPVAKRSHSYAFVIAAHNEESVIGNLVRSIKAQRYDGLIDCYVVADACTDRTAEVAREAGAIVWERNDLARRGKSWVLDFAFDRILNQQECPYEGFFVMDADNVISPDYVEIMNKAFDQGFLVCTSYRNSKNFDSSWVSAGYSLWFMRESRYLNNARMLLGTSCAISGSGWLVSASIIRGMHGWMFHTLTEDLQFTAFCASHNIRIGYAPAEFFDEQPTDFKTSWTQRMRWSRGGYQVFFSYWRDLVRGIFKGHFFASYDMLMTMSPAMFLTIISVFVNLAYLIIGTASRGFIATQSELGACVGSIVTTLVSSYGMFFLMGLVTTISERRHIHARSRWRVIANVFTFPIFELSYIPINVVALFKKVDWVPVKHDIAVNFDEVVSDGGTR